MKLTTFVFVAAALNATLAGAQERRALEVQAQSQGGKVATIAPAVRIPLETHLVKGAPYSAEVVSEFTQVLADGNRIVRRNTGRVFRDAQGRTRREDDSAPGHVSNIRITDPVGQVSYTLDPVTRTAWKTPSHVAGAMVSRLLLDKITDPAETERRRAVEHEIAAARVRSEHPAAAPPPPPPPPPPAAPAPPDAPEKRENLGTRNIEGVMAEGVRITRSIPAGAIGNEQPIFIVTEEWRSPELQVLVLTRTSDPRTGDMTYRLTNITRAEPNASWFEVPADYTLKETGVRRLAPVEK